MRTYGIVRIAKEVTMNNGTMKTTIAHNDYKKEGHFFTAVAFKGTGEVIFNNCKVGDRIFIDGEILNNNYENKEGKMVYQNQVIIHRFEFIEKKGTTNNDDMRPKFSKEQEDYKRQQDYPTIDVYTDDLPF